MSDGPTTDQLRDRAGRAIEDDLRRAVQAGKLGLALLEAGSMLSVLADHDPDFMANLMLSASEPRAAGGTGASVDTEAVAFALIDSRGALIRSSPRFLSWIGDPAESIDCRELVRRAVAGGRATGHVKTIGHGVLATIAIAHDSHSPWPEAMRRQGSAPLDRGVMMVVFAPSRSRVLVERAAAALGLSPLQREIAMALIGEPSLETAAARLQVGRETAKDALEGALKKAGVRRASQLVGRLIDLSCSLADRVHAFRGSAAALGLTPGEAAVAEHIEGPIVQAPPENIMGEMRDALALYFRGDMEASIALSGQVAGRIDLVKPVARVIGETMAEFEQTIALMTARQTRYSPRDCIARE